MYSDTLATIFNWKAVIDVSLVAVLFYQVISMLRGTRAAQVLIGMLVIFIAYVFSNVLQFDTLHWIISKFYSSFIIVVIVLFQDDIRRLLSQFGKGPFFSGIELSSGANVINEITMAAKSLSHERIGALIVFERSIGLDKLYDHSVRLDAEVSEQLLTSIFQSFSPLHDGAVIIQKNRISCASAHLPLSKNPRFSKKMGTRHSAAVGISEETDAVVLVVSEETGNISLAWEGQIQKQASAEGAKKMLHILLLPHHDRRSTLNSGLTRLLNTLKIKNRFGRHTSNPTQFERRHSLIEENGFEMAGQPANGLGQQIQIQFPREAKVQNVAPFTNSLIMSEFPQKPEVREHAQNETSLSSQQEESSLDKNEALKATTDLAPQDRLDPPLPKSRPPVDISIGGVSINQKEHSTEVSTPKLQRRKGKASKLRGEKGKG